MANSKVVGGVAASAPFLAVMRGPGHARCQESVYRDVPCEIDVVMRYAEWGSESADNLFGSRPIILMHGTVKAAHFLEGLLPDDVETIGFYQGEATRERGDAAAVAGLFGLDEPEHGFRLDDTTTPTVDYAYRFTYNEIAALCVKGGVCDDYPEIPDKVAKNPNYERMNATADVTRVVRDGETFWVVDIPSESQKQKSGMVIDTSSIECGYHLVKELPASQNMLAFGNSLDVVAQKQSEAAFQAGLAGGSFSEKALANALFGFGDYDRAREQKAEVSAGMSRAADMYAKGEMTDEQAKAYEEILHAPGLFDGMLNLDDKARYDALMASIDTKPQTSEAIVDNADEEFVAHALDVSGKKPEDTHEASADTPSLFGSDEDIQQLSDLLSEGTEGVLGFDDTDIEEQARQKDRARKSRAVAQVEAAEVEEAVSVEREKIADEYGDDVADTMSDEQIAQGLFG